jgi:branched-chain amino acid transport system permease protein
MTQLIQELVNGVSLGSTYALLALGLAMVFSILGLINFAHGELVTIGGYTMWTLFNHGFPWPAVLVLTLAGTTLAAVAMERIAFRPLRGASIVTLLITSFAVSFFIQVALQIFVSAEPQGIGVPNWTDTVWHMGDVSLPAVKVVTFAVTIAAVVLLAVFLRRTLLGVAMRAAAEDFDAVRLMGVRANVVVVAAFAISGLLAGVAAVLFFTSAPGVDSGVGTPLVINAFIGVILGGLGNLYGAVLGGFVLGLATSLLDANLHGTYTQFSQAFALAIVVGILLLRPQGLVGRSEGLM